MKMEAITTTKDGNEGIIMENCTSTDSDSFAGTGAAARIKALDRLTASGLRKCQIINKVSDIVRELVENSLDADATTIQVYLEKFGKDKIEVRDNGHGFVPSDVEHIFQGGYTSKLHDTSNLSRGQYLGFKGEALNAICAAGNVTVISKLSKEPAATKYKFDLQGCIVSQNKMAHSGGTTVIVEKLFENIRVRRQRLDNTTTATNELKEIEAYLKGVAIAYPKCHISLYHNTTFVWSKATVQTVEQSLYAVLGHNIAKKLGKYGPIQVQVGQNENDVHRSIELFLPIKPVDMRTMSYTSNKMSMIFCNRKRVYIRGFEKLIHRYVVANVEKPQPADQRRFPVSVVCIQVPPTEADFNLDMDKTKVFLIHQDAIQYEIESALIEFYGINLREGTEEAALENAEGKVSPVKNRIPADSTETDTGVGTFPANSAALTKVYDGSDAPDKSVIGTTSDSSVINKCPVLPAVTSAPSVTPILNVASASNSSRQITINEFLQEIPSSSLAFTESPVKTLNAEPVSITFPTSKPLSMSELNSSKKPIVANFEISVASQDSQEDDHENGLVRDTIPKDAPRNTAPLGQNGTGADEYQNWLDGRIKDKFGGVIENVVLVNEAPQTDKQQDPDRDRFLSALVAGTTNSTAFNRTIRPQSQQPTFFQVNPSEPPLKRPRNEDLGTRPTPLASPAVSGNAPRTPLHRQVTLDSLSKWPTPAGRFSQTASTSVVGVRIPLTPHCSTPPTFSKPTENTLPLTVPKPSTLHETQERTTLKPHVLDLHQAPAKKVIRQPNIAICTSKRLTPQIHREIKGYACNQLYIAQTYDSVGVFSPLNMIEYFPSETRDCWAPVATGSRIIGAQKAMLSKEEVSRMFQQFVTRSEINNTPVAGKIFHVLSKLPDLTQGIMY